MNIYNKDLIGAIILTAFAGLGLAGGTASFFWKIWFNSEKLRLEVIKEIHKQSWQPPAFKKWQLKFIQSKIWLWYGRILSSIVMFVLSSLFIIGLVFLFTSIARDM